MRRKGNFAIDAGAAAVVEPLSVWHRYSGETVVIDGNDSDDFDMIVEITEQGSAIQVFGQVQFNPPSTELELNVLIDGTELVTDQSPYTVVIASRFGLPVPGDITRLPMTIFAITMDSSLSSVGSHTVTLRTLNNDVSDVATVDKRQIKADVATGVDLEVVVFGPPP